VNEANCVGDGGCWQEPEAVRSNDPEVLRAALARESFERRRAECRADMQTEIAKLAHDLLVREPDIDGFFGGLAKEMVEESESHTCGVWLIDESGERCELWMAYVKDRLFFPTVKIIRRSLLRKSFRARSWRSICSATLQGGIRPSSTRTTTLDSRWKSASSATSAIGT